MSQKLKFSKPPKLLVFDVNETLLDLQKVQLAIQSDLDNKNAFSLWFSTLLQYSMVESITNQHHSFAEIGKATLQMTAKKLKRNVSDDSIRTILNLIKQLPPHPEVKNALARFKSNDFSMVALTNGSTEAVKKQMNFAEISEYFERLFSVDEVQSYKPQAITYQHVLNEMNIEAKDAMMVAAHPWDLAGAKAVGMQTAFIERPSQIYYSLAANPDFTASNLEALFDRISE